MPTRNVLDRLVAGERLLLDGGTGAELQRRGVSVDEGASTEPRPYTSSKGVKTAETLGAYANIGYGDNPKFGSSPDESIYRIDTGPYTPARYAEVAREWKEMGAQIIGGCCATGPEHIEAIAPLLKGA